MTSNIYFTWRRSTTFTQVSTYVTNNNKRAASRRVSQNKSSDNFNSQGAMTIQQPIYKPIYKFKRVIEGGTFDVSADGINPTLFGAQFDLSTLPSGPSDFTNLFDVYRIDRIDITWHPEYTELVDSGLASNAVNVNFNSAIDLTDATAPASVNELLQYSTVVSTSITKQHKRSWRPAILNSTSSPSYCWISSGATTIKHFGVKVAIPATGVAMNFVSRVTYHMSWAASR